MGIIDKIHRYGTKVVDGVAKFGEKHKGKLAVLGAVLALDSAVRSPKEDVEEKVTMVGHDYPKYHQAPPPKQSTPTPAPKPKPKVPSAPPLPGPDYQNVHQRNRKNLEATRKKRAQEKREREAAAKAKFDAANDAAKVRQATEAAKIAQKMREQQDAGKPKKSRTNPAKKVVGMAKFAGAVRAKAKGKK